MQQLLFSNVLTDRSKQRQSLITKLFITEKRLLYLRNNGKISLILEGACLMTQEFIGYNGSVIVDNVKVALKFKKSSGKADKEIYIQSISSIELKKPTLLNRGGYIKILFQGSQDNNNMKRFRDILSNENAVFFIGKHQYEAMIQAKQLIDKYISEYHQ